jgi:diaminohydroxyphosphoribosylaminopyrimidine deaminase/5-amino-6-(5-phosphoribosylamino)uracil reductase
MQRALTLAEHGAGKVSPNPMVGAVLVHEGRIIGEGFHEKSGLAHAEVNCFNSVVEADKELIPASVLYVTLEPCSHFGKTPPCVDRILAEGVKKVVVAIQDPFVQVSGKGIKKLKDAGVEVVEGVLSEAATFINRRFLKFYTQRQPYIILKWAQTRDGFLATGDKRLHITGQDSNVLVHKWRAEEDAILVGAQTAIVDDPLLTVRLVSGKSPKRFILANQAELPLNLRLLQDEVTIFNTEREERYGITQYLKYDANKGLNSVLEQLYNMGIQSILVEGGANTIRRFLDAGLFDEVRVLTNFKMEVGQGLRAPELPCGLELISQSVDTQDEVRQYIKK